MPPILRHILAFFAGAIVALVLIGGIERLGHWAIPLPEGVSFATMEQAKVAITKLSTGAFLFVFAAHALGAFGGIVVAGLISPGKPGIWAAVEGGLIFAGSVANLFLLPIPPLIATADLTCVALAIVAGYLFLRGRTA